MSYGLICKNANGVVVLDTTKLVLNYEEISTTQTTIAPGDSQDLTIEGIHNDDVLLELEGTGAEDISDASNADDTITLTNDGNTSITIDVSFWRLR